MWLARKIVLIVANILSVALVAYWTYFIFSSHGFSQILLMEMMVPLTLLVVALIAWRSPLFGGLLYAFLGGFYLYFAWGRTVIPDMAAFSGPLFFVALLFLVGGIKWR